MPRKNMTEEQKATFNIIRQILRLAEEGEIPLLIVKTQPKGGSTVLRYWRHMVWREFSQVMNLYMKELHAISSTGTDIHEDSKIGVIMSADDALQLPVKAFHNKDIPVKIFELIPELEMNATISGYEVIVLSADLGMMVNTASVESTVLAMNRLFSYYQKCILNYRERFSIMAHEMTGTGEV